MNKIQGRKVSKGELNNRYGIFGANGHNKKDVTRVEVLRNGTILHVTEYFNNIASPNNIRSDFYIDYSHPLVSGYLQEPISEIKDNYFNHLIEEELVGLTYKLIRSFSPLNSHINNIETHSQFNFDKKTSETNLDEGLYCVFNNSLTNHQNVTVSFTDDKKQKSFNNEIFK